MTDPAPHTLDDWDRGPAARRGGWLASLVAGNRDDGLDWSLEAVGRRHTRTNHVAFCSAKGGVGKTTSTLLAGDRLAATTHLRCLAVDADPNRGTLGSLPPATLRNERSLADLVREVDRLDCAAGIRPYVSLLPSGLHILGTPNGARPSGEIGADDYGRLLRALGRFYELVLLDMGPGLADPLARLVLELSDHAVVVTTPELITIERVLTALDELALTIDPRHITLLLNQAPTRRSALQLIQTTLAPAPVAGHAHIPFDPTLAASIDAGAYNFEDLTRDTQLAVTQLALSIGEGLT